MHCRAAVSRQPQCLQLYLLRMHERQGEYFGSTTFMYAKHTDEKLGINIHSLNNAFCKLRKDGNYFEYVTINSRYIEIVAYVLLLVLR